ncbi:hypothetical protein [Salinispora cortesiana]|nr:hypothetical protein [Salinispora cortesiana]
MPRPSRAAVVALGAVTAVVVNLIVGTIALMTLPADFDAMSKATHWPSAT